MLIQDHGEHFRGGTVERGSIGDAGVRLEPSKGDHAVFTSRECTAPFPFNELLPSWNVEVPEDGGFVVELRAAETQESTWSPWLRVGAWGKQPDVKKVVKFDGGRIAIDYMIARKRMRRVQYRIIASGAVQTLRRFALCFSDRTGKATPAPPSPVPISGRWDRRLPVPFKTQKIDDERLAGRICSPTSVAMLLAYRGVDRPAAEVARRLFDADHDIYGNWTNAVQGAFTYGVPGFVARFAHWSEVQAMIARGQPLIISIAAKEGELTGAPYEKTAGHLLVLCGFDGKGGVTVNDPAARDAKRGQITYSMKELEHVWLRRGGTSYVLLQKP